MSEIREEDRPMTLRERVDLHLDQHAERSLEEAGSNLKKATDAMVSRVRGDPRMREEVYSVLLEAACHDILRKILQRQNKDIWHETEKRRTQQKSGDRLRSAANLASRLRLMNYMLMGGVRLGDATYKDLRNNFVFQNRQAKRMAQTAKWFDLISEKMKGQPDDAVVRSVLTEDDLFNLQSAAIGEKE